MAPDETGEEVVCEPSDDMEDRPTPQRPYRAFRLKCVPRPKERERRSTLPPPPSFAPSQPRVSLPRPHLPPRRGSQPPATQPPATQAPGTQAPRTQAQGKGPSTPAEPHKSEAATPLASRVPPRPRNAIPPPPGLPADSLPPVVLKPTLRRERAVSPPAARPQDRPRDHQPPSFLPSYMPVATSIAAVSPARPRWHFALAFAGALVGSLGALVVLATAMERGSASGAVGRAVAAAERARQAEEVTPVRQDVEFLGGAGAVKQEPAMAERVGAALSAAAAATSCGQRGSLREVHVEATVAPSGKVRAHVIDHDVDKALKRCLTDALSTARIAPFKGPALTILLAVPVRLP